MFSPCEALPWRSGYTTTATTTGEDCPAGALRARVTYSAGGVGGPPPTLEMGVVAISTASDFVLDEILPTPWARKGARYVRMPAVKDIWRAKWRLSRQRPRDGLRRSAR